MGGALSFDLSPKAPIGIQVEDKLLWNHDSAGGSKLETTKDMFGVGLFYTGKPEVLLGIEGFATINLKANESGGADSGVMIIGGRYF